MLRPAELVRAAAVARQFFLERKTKLAIGQEFGLSRFQVARMLDRAIELGLVHIEVDLPAMLDDDLSARLANACGLRHALVVSVPDDPPETMRARLGEVGAGLLAEVVSEGDALGVGWGRTVSAMAGSLGRLPKCTVVQLMAALGGIGTLEDPVEIARLVARTAGGPFYPLYAPMIADTEQAADAIRRQPYVQATLKHHDHLATAVISIGSWDPPDSMVRDVLLEPDRASVETLGPRAEVCGRLFSDQGRPVPTEFDGRLIGISANQLVRVPEVIALAGGATKAAAICALMAAGVITSLVTNTTAANLILQDALANREAVGVIPVAGRNGPA